MVRKHMQAQSNQSQLLVVLRHTAVTYSFCASRLKLEMSKIQCSCREQQNTWRLCRLLLLIESGTENISVGQNEHVWVWMQSCRSWISHKACTVDVLPTKGRLVFGLMLCNALRSSQWHEKPKKLSTSWLETTCWPANFCLVKQG